MKPLYHPPVDSITVEAILHALSDPVRVRILSRIINADSAHTCASLARIDDRTLAKSTLSHHFRVLREAGLVRSEKHGVELRNTSRCPEIAPRYGALVSAILNSYACQNAQARDRPSDN